jgi:para-nitrobenzyl esterase
MTKTFAFLASSLCASFLLATAWTQETAKVAVTLHAAGSESAAINQNPLEVRIAAGKIRGKEIGAAKVHAFLGIPYAAPPIGALRWVAPQPVAPWNGVLDATAFQRHCAQNHDASEDRQYSDSGESEDCLYLNVYTPATGHSGDRLPVMFWIHGGGYAGGAGSELRHNGDFLPTRGVILVTFNYRLGIFGFLALDGFAAEANGHAGNYAFLDMVQALTWVRDNIAAFGGDPRNVTIFGESAGSSAACTLMASPLARGLFQKAIGESGGALVGTRRPLGQELLPDIEVANSAWAKEALGTDDPAALRTLPTAALLEAAGGKSPMNFGPVVDGLFLTETVAESYVTGRQAHVPLMAGWNMDEGVLLVHGKVTAEEFKSKAAVLFPDPDRATEFLRLYPAETDNEATRSAVDFDGDNLIAYGTWNWLEEHRKTGQSPVYRYHFELIPPPSKYHGAEAFHSDEIEYVFGTLDTRPNSTWRPEDRKLSEQMMDYWTNFAKTGNPNGPGLLEWPVYEAGDPLIHFDATITVGTDTLRPRYEFLEKGRPTLHF